MRLYSSPGQSERINASVSTLLITRVQVFGIWGWALRIKITGVQAKGSGDRVPRIFVVEFLG